ncbi:MAG TPA: transposase family protein [Ktedonobacteraceae bacterium]|nr:transposase family protein [Ktedonobacteraceae bacterium]
MPMSYAEVSQKELRFLDLTSLTVEEFQQILPVFEEKFRERMKYFRLDGKPRIGREYQAYVNCPLPTPEDRLFFILVYLKNNPLQVLHGQMFDMPQNKANQWIHTLLPVLLVTMRSLGDAPARSLEEFAERLGKHVLIDEASSAPDEMHQVPDRSTPSGDAGETVVEQAKPESESPPLFAMMGRNDASSARKTKMSRKTIIAARRNVTQ